jgi:hypothetical protein
LLPLRSSKLLLVYVRYRAGRLIWTSYSIAAVGKELKSTGGGALLDLIVFVRPTHFLCFIY